MGGGDEEHHPRLDPAQAGHVGRGGGHAAQAQRQALAPATGARAWRRPCGPACPACARPRPRAPTRRRFGEPLGRRQGDAARARARGRPGSGATAGRGGGRSSRAGGTYGPGDMSAIAPPRPPRLLPVPRRRPGSAASRLVHPGTALGARAGRSGPVGPHVWRGPDSNRRHHDFQSCALPTELPRQDVGMVAPVLPRLRAGRIELMAHEEHEATYRRFSEAISRGDIEGAAAELAPTVEIDDRDIPDADGQDFVPRVGAAVERELGELAIGGRGAPGPRGRPGPRAVSDDRDGQGKRAADRPPRLRRHRRVP